MFPNRQNIFTCFFIVSVLLAGASLYGSPARERKPDRKAGRETLPQTVGKTGVPELDTATMRTDSTLIPILPDSLRGESTLMTASDTTLTDSIPSQQEYLESNIIYTATDSIVQDEIRKRAYLYNQAKVTYGDIILDAGYIELDLVTNVAYARGIKDSTGNYTQKPIMTQGDKTYDTYALTYNFNTNRAYIKNVKTTEMEGYGAGRSVKKETEDVFYARDFYFSTDEKLQGWIDGTGEETDYYIRSSKVKLTTNESIVAGLSQLYIADIPTPLVLPFAFFPMNIQPTSGIILPSYNVSQSQGFGLVGGGYYLALNDYVHAIIKGDIYTKGSWNLNTTVNYIWKYHFAGSLNFNYGKVIYGEIGLPGYSKSAPWQLAWSHRQDTKMSPSFTFSASVNMSSTNYYEQSLDQIYTNNYIDNSVTSSSINITKSFPGTPFNLSLSVRQSQNNATQLMSLSLPQITLTMNRIFPFKKKDSSGRKWYEKINLSWTMNAQNDINNLPTGLFLTGEMFDYAKNGIKHSIPISANYKLLKFFTVNLGVNYNESWYFKTIEKHYDNDRDTLITQYKDGFKAYRDFSLNASLNTTVYGTFNFKGDGNLKAIRHVMTPSISYSFRPDFSTDFWGYFDAIQTGDQLGAIHYYTYFEEGIYDKPSYNSMSQSVSFSLSNTFEGKVRDKVDSTKTKKIKLLDQLSLSASYNFTASSYKLSTIPLSGGTSFMGGKIGWNFRFTFDPYALDKEGNRVDKYAVSEGQGLVRMTQASTSLNFGLSSDMFQKKKENEEGMSKEDSERANLIEGETADSTSRKRKKRVFEETEDGFGKYRNGYWLYQPKWNFAVSYALSYNKPTNKATVTNSLPINGSITFSDKWNMSFSTSYDFEVNKINNLNLNFARSLGTWNFTFTWAPISPWSTYSFYIGVSSSILRDLKWDKRDSYSNSLFR